jgi:hypothetical protein
MKTETTEFEQLYALNVNDKAEKKNNLTYLSWAWAWAEFVKVYPEAKYEVVKNENMMPYFKDESGAFCYTRVTAGGLTHEMWLPVMDYKNQALKAPNAFDVNKTVMRCLTKNLAMFGLGLYIYAGEDLPEGEEHPLPPKQLKDILRDRNFSDADIKDFYGLHGVTNAGYAEQLAKNPELEKFISGFHAQPRSA